jgi:cobalamin biosynthesis protein CobT
MSDEVKKPETEEQKPEAADELDGEIVLPDDEEDEEEQSSEEGSGDGETEEEEGSSEVEDAEEVKKKFRELNEQRKHWRDRAKKLEEELKNRPEPKKSSSNKAETSKHSEERIDFRFEHPELSTQAVDEIETYATAKGISLEEALKSPLIKTFVASEKKRKELLHASPGTRSQPLPKRQGKDWTTADPTDVAREAARIKMQGRK